METAYIASILLSGDNELVDELHYLTSWELYHNAKYYANHPLISQILDDHPDKFNSKTETFSNFLSDHDFETLDPNNVEQCVISEALNTTRDVYVTIHMHSCPSFNHR